ncbi:MAG TPA: hypothetical protein VN924_01820 [Bryobacteraceae bacterium]|jgi:hypothetical protein|nr:hypothetical protein [Bryobacteraceae bacterium]
MTQSSAFRKLTRIAYIALGMALLSASLATAVIRARPATACGGPVCSGGCDVGQACGYNPSSGKCQCFLVE